jgi:hypothetical protein
MKPINIRGQGRTPLPTALGPPEDGAKPSRPPILITQRKLRSKAVLPPLAWPQDGRASRMSLSQGGEHPLEASRALGS